MIKKVSIVVGLMMCAACPNKSGIETAVEQKAQQTVEVKDSGQLNLGSQLMSPGQLNDTGQDQLDNHGAVVHPGEKARE